MLCLELNAKGRLKPLFSKESRDCLLEALYALLQIIPTGKVTTYNDLSKVLHINPRVVARMLSRNTRPIVIPCHRVVRSDGSLGGYTLNGKSRKEFKSKLLMLEGVLFSGNARVGKEFFVSIYKELIS